MGEDGTAVNRVGEGDILLGLLVAMVIGDFILVCFIQCEIVSIILFRDNRSVVDYKFIKY